MVYAEGEPLAVMVEVHGPLQRHQESPRIDARFRAYTQTRIAIARGN